MLARPSASFSCSRTRWRSSRTTLSRFKPSDRPSRAAERIIELPNWLASLGPDTLVLMSPNRRELEPNRRAQQERARRRGLLIRDAYWALIIAIILVGGAKLFGVL